MNPLKDLGELDLINNALMIRTGRNLLLVHFFLRYSTENEYFGKSINVVSDNVRFNSGDKKVANNTAGFIDARK